MPLGDGGDVGAVHVAVPGGAKLGLGVVMISSGERSSRGKAPLAPASENQRLTSLSNLVGLFGGQVVRLGPVDIGVVELPLVVVEVAPPGQVGWVVTAFQPSCQMDRDPSME